MRHGEQFCNRTRTIDRGCTLRPIVPLRNLGHDMQGEGHNPEDLLGPFNDVERRYMPDRLFTAGDLDLLNGGGRVAVVGSRNASSQGLARARRLARLLVAEGIVVVSGLAKGIDAAAHREAIGRGGHTIAVIGTPLDREYPSENRLLQRRLMVEQLVISQFPEGYATKPGCFPMRNRTMALIADATVIIEAADGSGTISQAWEALRLGRPLFIAESALQLGTLTWPSKLLDHGMKVLSDATLPDLFEAAPSRAGMADVVPF